MAQELESIIPGISTTLRNIADQDLDKRPGYMGAVAFDIIQSDSITDERRDRIKTLVRKVYAEDEEQRAFIQKRIDLRS